MSAWSHSLLGFFGAGLIRAYGRTWRVSFEGREHEAACRAAGSPVLYAFLHGRLLVAAFAYRDRCAGILVSRHRDGAMFVPLAERLGFRVYRGSSTRGGAAGLLQMCHESPEQPLSMTTDGPRGPIGSVKEGVVVLASVAGRSILPSAAAAHPAWRLRSWDRFVLPKPGARVRIVFGPPIVVPHALPRGERAAWTERVAAALAAAERQAWGALGREPDAFARHVGARGLEPV